MFVAVRNVFKTVNARRFLPTSVRCISVESESGIFKSTVPDLHIPDASIPEYVFKDFHKFPNKIALECAQTGRSYTYEDVLVKSRNLSRALRKKLKLSPGDILAVLLPNVPEYPICLYGCLQANVIVTPINPMYTPDEISKQLLDNDAKAIITLSIFHPVAAASIKLAKKNIPIITVKAQKDAPLPEGAVNIQEFLDTEINIDDLPPANTDDIALLPYSSGTTGLPKGVPLTHKNILSNITQAGHCNFRLHEDTTANHQDVIPAILPFFHIFGITAIQFLYMAVMAKIVTIAQFTPELFLKTLAQHKPQSLIIVPTIINLMANQAVVKKEYLQPLRNILCGAASLSAQDEEKVISKIGKHIEIRQGYGLTETSPAVLMSSVRTLSLELRGTAGEVIPNTTVKLVDCDDPNKTVTSPGVQGELLVKGPQVMKGYYKKHNNSEVFHDGYFKTGDLLYFDEHKAFYVVDRLKELIKVKGFQVAPAELESVLREHPDILDVAVIGIPHVKYGEVPRAYLVPKPDHTIKPENIQQFVANKVVEYKHLKGGVGIIDKIPKNLSGKILRRELRSLYNSEAKL